MYGVQAPSGLQEVFEKFPKWFQEGYKGKGHEVRPWPVQPAADCGHTTMCRVLHGVAVGQAHSRAPPASQFPAGSTPAASAAVPKQAGAASRKRHHALLPMQGSLRLRAPHVFMNWYCPSSHFRVQVRDLRRLLELYQRWHPRLFNHCDYNQFESTLEKMSGTNALKVSLHGLPGLLCACCSRLTHNS